MKRGLRRKIIVTLIISMLLLAGIPSAAFADSTKSGNKPAEIWINNVNIMEEGNENAVEGASYDSDTNTLTLNNVTIDQANSDFENYVDFLSSYAIVSGIYADGDLNIRLEGENKGIYSGMFWYTILINGELNITGPGSLDIFGSYGIQTKNDVNISGTGTMTIESEVNCINSQTGNINITADMEKIKLIGLKGVLCCQDEQANIIIGEKSLSDSDAASPDMIIEKGEICPVSQAKVMVGGGDVLKESVKGVTYDEDSGILTLDNAVISSGDEIYKSAIFAAEDLTIVLEGNNTIAGDDISYGIFAKGNIEIKGSGDLTVKTQKVGFYSSDNISINDKQSFIRFKNNDGRVMVTKSLTICGEAYSEFYLAELANSTSIIIEQGEIYWLPEYIIVNGRNIIDGENVKGVSYDYKAGVLNLKDAKITESYGEEYYNSGIYYYGNNVYCNTLTVNLEGENIIKGDNMDHAVYSDYAHCRITGNGTLNAEADIHGVFSKYELTVDSSVKELCLSAGLSAFYANAGYYVNIGNDLIKLTDQKVCIQSGEVVSQESETLYELKVGDADILAGEKVDGVSFDPDTCTLTLENADIVTDSEYLIKASGNLNIRLIGHNSILKKNETDDITIGIYVEAGNLNIYGNGTLVMEDSHYSQIMAENSVSISGDVMVAPSAGVNLGALYADTLNINNNAVLIGTYYFVTEVNHRSGISVQIKAGTSEVKGNVTLSHDLAIPEGVALNMAEGASLTIPQGVTLTIPKGSSLTVPQGATLINNGKIIIEGVLYTDQKVKGNGTIEGVITPIKKADSGKENDSEVNEGSASNNDEQKETVYVDRPKTGDNSHGGLVMWAMVMLISAAGACIVIKSGKKRNDC